MTVYRVRIRLSGTDVEDQRLFTIMLCCSSISTSASDAVGWFCFSVVDDEELSSLLVEFPENGV